MTPTITTIKKDDGYYHALIDGKETGIKAKYKNVVRRNAAQWLREQEELKRYEELKECGL